MILVTRLRYRRILTAPTAGMSAIARQYAYRKSGKALRRLWR